MAHDDYLERHKAELHATVARLTGRGDPRRSRMIADLERDLTAGGYPADDQSPRDLAGTAVPGPGGFGTSQVSEATGVSRSTLHYWTHVGLLRPIGRTSAGHLVYGPDVFDVILKIRSFQDRSRPLQAIRDELYGTQASAR